MNHSLLFSLYIFSFSVYFPLHTAWACPPADVLQNSEKIGMFHFQKYCQAQPLGEVDVERGENHIKEMSHYEDIYSDEYKAHLVNGDTIKALFLKPRTAHPVPYYEVERKVADEDYSRSCYGSLDERMTFFNAFKKGFQESINAARSENS